MLDENEIELEEKKFYAEREKCKNLIPITTFSGIDVNVDHEGIIIGDPVYDMSLQTGKIKQVKLGNKNKNQLF